MVQRKPPKWGVDKGLVDPKWRWFWDNAIACFPLWEGGGPATELVTNQPVAFTSTTTGAWTSSRVGPSPTYAGGDPDADWVFESTGIYLPNFDGDADFTFFAQFEGHASFQVDGEVIALLDTGDTVPRIRLNNQSGNTRLETYDGGAAARSVATTSADVRWYSPGKRLRLVASRTISGANETLSVTARDLATGLENTNTIGPHTALSYTQPSGGWRVVLARGVERLDYAYILKGTPTDEQKRRLLDDPFGPFRMMDEHPYIFAGTFTPVVNAYRFYEDGTESGSSAIDAEDTDISRNVDSDSDLHLRVRIDETGNVAGATTDDYALEYSKNSGSWTAVTASSSNVQSDTISDLTDGAATTDRASGLSNPGSGSFVAGEQEEANGVVEDLQLTAGDFTELVWALTLISADLLNTDTLDFRVTLNGGAPGMTNSVMPTITATKTGAAGFAYRPLSLMGVGA